MRGVGGGDVAEAAAAPSAVWIVLVWLRRLLVLLRSALNALVWTVPSLPGAQPVNATSSKTISSAASAAAAERKQRFLQEAGKSYGYGSVVGDFDEWHAREFPQLKGVTYLDHAGATLYSATQLHAVHDELASNVLGNPHSQNDNGSLSARLVEEARAKVLLFFNVSSNDYTCVFCAGATAALKLVAEQFSWTTGSKFVYTRENHNSVLGIRQVALQHGATSYAVDVHREDSGIWHVSQYTRQQRGQVDIVTSSDGAACHLFAMPAECNFSGAKFDVELIQHAQQGGLDKEGRGRWLVLLDAAKACTTSPLDLAAVQPDFVALSFYKLFGYPTGLGALLVKNDALQHLHKSYFGGGTVEVSLAEQDYVKFRQQAHERLEDGTVPYLSILAIRHGFARLNKLGMRAIEQHTGSLTRYAACRLSSLRHYNKRPVVQLYGNHHSAPHAQGPVLALSILRADGSVVGYREVEQLASLHRIQLRTGCFCNPGACCKWLGLSPEDMRANHEGGHVCWDDRDVIDGKPSGAVRVSLGYISSFEDVDAFIVMVEDYFVQRSAEGKEVNQTSSAVERSTCSLAGLLVYPIKSCGGNAVQSWPMGRSGLLFDREWVVVDSTGAALTQKRYTRLTAITPVVDLASRRLIVTSPCMAKELSIPLDEEASHCPRTHLSVCGECVTGRAYGSEVSDWFSAAVGVRCSLVRQGVASRAVRSIKPAAALSKRQQILSFSNEGQVLAVCTASVDAVNVKISDKALHVSAQRYRPNFIIHGGHAFQEDAWTAINMGGVTLTVTGPCGRCSMINIDQQTGMRSTAGQPLLALASFRRHAGRINFGVLLSAVLDDHAAEPVVLRVGDKATPVLEHREAPASSRAAELR
eukprot:jgi/Chlat1/6669/Chrsp49S06159